jgi:hypothetical protein
LPRPLEVFTGSGNPHSTHRPRRRRSSRPHPGHFCAPFRAGRTDARPSPGGASPFSSRVTRSSSASIRARSSRSPAEGVVFEAARMLPASVATPLEGSTSRHPNCGAASGGLSHR